MHVKEVMFRMAMLLGAVLVANACTPPRYIPPLPPSRGHDSPDVVTADGQVLGVRRASPGEPATHVHLTLRLEGERQVEVELGPGWYLDEQGLSFVPPDRVLVEGTRTQRGGGSVIVARRIRKGSASVTLRDERGEPVWNSRAPDSEESESAPPEGNDPAK